MTINEQLKALRIEAGLTQEQLGKVLGKYTRQNVSNIESGKTSAGLKIIENWAKACGKKAEITFSDLEQKL